MAVRPETLAKLRQLSKLQQQIAWALASGKSNQQTAEELECSDVYISQLLHMPDYHEFQEVLRELMTQVGTAIVEERLRIAKQAIEQAIASGKVKTKEDVLHWLEYVGKLVEGPEGSTKVKVSWEEPKTMEELFGELEK